MTKILPIIMNTSFERLAVIDDYTSFIWATRYYASGDFELVVDVSEKNIGLFVQDYYVIREDDENVGVIENVIIERNNQGDEQIIVSGRFLGGALLSRRIIAQQTTLNDTVSNVIIELLYQNVTAPAITARKIPNFIIADMPNIRTNLQAQYTGNNLLDVISTICEKNGLGFKVTLNANNEFAFAVYQGADRTYDQTVNPWVIFSDKYDNLLSSEYEENYQNIVNAVLVAGEGEGLDRKTLWVTQSGTPSGINRHELYYDQRNIRSNDGEISPTSYNALLAFAGTEKLTTYTSAFTGTVYFDNIKYKEDINVGDICVIQNKRWGLYIYPRLVEVIESVSESGEYSIIPTFGI